MENPNEIEFLRALSTTRDTGSERLTRNGVTTAILGYPMRFDMQKGFPAITTKYLASKVMIAENLWFLDAGKETGGRLSLAKLNEYLGKPADASNIWTKDQARFEKNKKAQFDGDCGRIYGAQWRDWRTSNGKIDQFKNVIKQLKDDPFSRYHVVTAWNPGEIPDMCLPPCHMMMQFFVREDPKGFLRLSLIMFQRSADLFLGVPFNIAGYSLLLHMTAQCVEMVPDELVVTLGDCHIYLGGYDDKRAPDRSRGHLNQVNEQLSREPFEAPQLLLNPKVKNIDDFTMDDIKLIGYQSHEKIPAEML